MPVIERRKLGIGGPKSFQVTVPKSWVEFFRLKPGQEVELVVDTPVVVFPPNLGKREKIDALQKICKLIELLPEPPEESNLPNQESVEEEGQNVPGV
jgi:bifunctional DNA-binding transcriptional regulator/antitoxin component of YhaV-PrlF toxin-antitoxin module